MNYTKHETAVIDAGAEIVEGPRVWNWMHVCGCPLDGNIPRIPRNRPWRIYWG